MVEEDDFGRNLSQRNPKRGLKGTRLHELHLYPLPSDADEKKVKALIKQFPNIQIKEVRILKKNSKKGASAFVVFFDDASAARVLNAFQHDPLYVENRKVEVNYTVDFKHDLVKEPRIQGSSKQLVNRIRAAFSWTTENNRVQLDDLPARLENLVPSTSYTKIGTTFSCDEQHIVCKTFSKDPDAVKDQPPVIRMCDIPNPVHYSCADAYKMYRTLQTLPTTAAPKPSKSVKRRAAKKREAVKIEAKIEKQQNLLPLKPGMGRGFSQLGQGGNITVPAVKQSHDVSISREKPCAVICPTQREQPLHYDSEKCGVLNKGRGSRIVTTDMMDALRKFC